MNPFNDKEKLAVACAKLKTIHAEWIGQSKLGSRRYSRSSEERQVFSDCADEIQEIINQLEQPHISYGETYPYKDQT